MKLSEMNNREALKTICKLSPHIKKIVGDNEVLDIWYRKLDLKNAGDSQETRKEQAKYVSEKFLDLIPLILEKHEKEVFSILSILNGRTFKEIKEQSFLDTITQIQELLSDPALVKLFTL